MAAGLALICIVATMAQQSKMSNSGSHLISKMLVQSSELSILDKIIYYYLYIYVQVSLQ